MSAIQQLLTDHLDIWTAADTAKKSGRGRSSGNAASVYGIKKLRELILELAVRGKLVPQDASDEPASELLKRIATEKAKLVAEGKIKKSKPLAEITNDEKPFELPVGWEWSRLNTLCILENGDRGKNYPNKSALVEAGIPFINAGHLQNGLIDKNQMTFITKEHFDILRGGKFQENDILFCLRGSLGKSALVKELEAGAIASSLVIVRLFPNLDATYFVNYFDCLLCSQMVKKYDNGTAQPNLSSTDLAKFLVPLPPLAEQHRIVAKVDELMALCDQLENQHNNAAVAHEKLVTYLLGTLTLSQNAEDFNTHWQRISEHFDTLFTTEASIDALKQTLLQLAVMGKLVPQDPNDEPASELLKRIQAEKAKLIAEGKIKKSKPLAPICDEEKPFELPIGWEWARLSELIAGMDSGWSPACLENKSPSDNVWGVLKTTAVQIMQYLEQENKELPDKLTPRPEAEAKVGDILFTRAGPINRVAISCLVEATRKKLMISDKIIRFHPIETGIDGHFLVLCLNTGATASYLEKAKSGMAASQVNISQEKLRSAPIPLPPLKIQKLIVSKVVEMTAICDHLKGRLTESNELQQKLADTLVEQAI